MRDGPRLCLLLGLHQTVPAVLGYDFLHFPLLLCEFSRTVVDFFYLSPSRPTLTPADQILLLYTHPMFALLRVRGLHHVCAGSPRHQAYRVGSTTSKLCLRYVFLLHFLHGFAILVTNLRSQSRPPSVTHSEDIPGVTTRERGMLAAEDAHNLPLQSLESPKSRTVIFAPEALPVKLPSNHPPTR